MDDDILLGDLLRDLLRFLERLRDLYFFVLSFRLSRDLDNVRLDRLDLGDSDRCRFRDSDRGDRLREMECRLDRDRLRETDRLREVLRLVRDDDLLRSREIERQDLEYDRPRSLDQDNRRRDLLLDRPRSFE